MAKMQQDAQTIEQLTAALQAANQREQTKALQLASVERMETAKIDSENRQKAAEIRSDDWQAAMKAQVDLLTAEMRSRSNEDIALMRAQLAHIETQINAALARERSASLATQ